MPFDYANTSPNLKALRRIGFAFIASAVLCFAISIALIAGTKPPQHSTSATAARAAGSARGIARGK